mmetsp:Transcript_136001/g.247437  ORF Transcript_136001/g.247437 Transcript_136001/m.247437 type:complete len:253 (+) Transcript_136001:92-850(+)
MSMSMYVDLNYVKEDCLDLMDRAQDARESNCLRELQEITSRRDLTLQERQDFWHEEARLAGQFAYMRRLARSATFVSSVMDDFVALDRDRSGRLDMKEIEDYLSGKESYKLLMSKSENAPLKARDFLRDLDVDGDGAVSRAEWLMYVAYLHWSKNNDHIKIVEKIVEAEPQDRVDRDGHHVLKTERILQRGGTKSEMAEIVTNEISNLQQAHTGRKPTMIQQRTVELPDGTAETIIELVEVDEEKKGKCLCQ